MFVNSKVDDLDLTLTFIKSLNVKAFPCGRRQSLPIAIDTDNNPDTASDQYSIPFDPEARLNTEANNRRHSSLNGYTQTYLDKWDAVDKTLSLVLAGYLFNIDLKDLKDSNGNYLEGADQQAQINSFASAISGTASSTTDGSITNSIYANILIEEVPLFSNKDEGLSYTTGVLRNQTASEFSNVCLDLPISNDVDKLAGAENYYFSALSFSTSPITKPITGDNTYVLISNDDTRSLLNVYKGTLHQQVISLCILNKVDGTWQIHEPARLPKIEHGDTVDSIKVTTINANNINKVVDNTTKPMPTIDIAELNDGTWQLRFSSVTKLPKS